MTDLGTVLSNTRKSLGYAQTDVAKLLGISQANIVKYEKNKIRKPSREMLEKFAKLYSLNVEQLLAYAYPKSPERVPKQVYEMLEKPDAIPFLIKACNDYNAYINSIKAMNQVS